MTTETRDILDRIRARLPEVLGHLLIPGGKRSGKKWLCGSPDGGPGDSCNIELEGDKAGVYQDFATGEAGSISMLWKRNMNCPDYSAVIADMAKWLGLPPLERASSKPLDPRNIIFTEPKVTASNQADPQPRSAPPEDDPMPPPFKPQEIDWDTCLVDFKEEHAAAVCEARGFSPRFVDWLHEQEMIGLYKECVAFPVHDSGGKVVRIHYKARDHWQYYPKGGETAPLVIGAPILHAAEVLLFESQWDACAMLDRLDAHNPDNTSRYCAYITRGANSNTDISHIKVPKVTACPQNDPAEKASKTTGRTPAEEWLHKLKASKAKDTAFRVFDTPLEFKDANDWLRTATSPGCGKLTAAVHAAQNPILKTVKTFKQLLEHAATLENDQDSLIGYHRRFLGRAGTLLIIGPSGIGKSSLVTAFAMHAAAAIDWNGIKFRRPLRTLVIQAENDDGDIAEMIAGVATDPFFQEHFTQDKKASLNTNLFFQQVSDKTGPAFVKHVGEMIRDLQIDLVVIDPLLSYVGDDISQQKVASGFLRDHIQPLVISTGVMMVVVHHTGKPPKDSKTMKGWTNNDFSYMGLGSSELVNWARAIFVIVPTEDEKVFQLRITKRGTRAGLRNDYTGEVTERIHIKHSSGIGIFWRQTDYQPPPEEEGRKAKADPRAKPRYDVSEYFDYVPEHCSHLELDAILLGELGLSVSEAADAVREMRRKGMIVLQKDKSFRKKHCAAGNRDGTSNPP